jgi:FRG domain
MQACFGASLDYVFFPEEARSKMCKACPHASRGPRSGTRMETAMMSPRQEFSSKNVQSWDELIDTIKRLLEGGWLFRGQADDWSLQSTLERHINSWALDPNHAPALEAALAREFRRRVRGEEQSFIQDDMLNCLALMRHHGAPTRLLDCTYSPFVAVQTALREVNPKYRPVIWCFRTEWIDQYCWRVLGRASVKLRPDGRGRIRFDALSKRRPPAKLVVHDNPYFLNERLTAHQGVFLFAGDIRTSFCENLKAMKGCELKKNVFKLYLDFDNNGKRAAVKTLKRMNVSSTVLFPGLDGFARSLGEELPFYDELYGGPG